MNEKKYFNTTTQGLAFLNEVSDKINGDSTSQLVKLAAIMGPEDKVTYETMRLWVRGEDAQAAVNKLKGYLSKDNKITVTFVAGDCKARGFITDSGTNPGTLMTYQEGALIYIKSARVNGEEVYRAPEKNQ